MRILLQILGAYDIDYEGVSREYQTMLKNSGQAPQMSAYDDDDEREEFEQMRKPTGNLGSAKSKTPTLDNFGRDFFGKRWKIGSCDRS
jgi:ATP-dependent Clp protease ATP-binding subunit ClpC